MRRTSWDAPYEDNSTARNTQYRTAWKKAVLDAPDICLGGYAFLWGHKWEGTSTWFGMFVPGTGERLSPVDVCFRRARRRRDREHSVLRAGGTIAFFGVGIRTPTQRARGTTLNWSSKSYLAKTLSYRFKAGRRPQDALLLHDGARPRHRYVLSLLVRRQRLAHDTALSKLTALKQDSNDFRTNLAPLSKCIL